MIPWAELDSKPNVEEMWEYWKVPFLQVLDKHAPTRSKRIRKKVSLPWAIKKLNQNDFEEIFSNVKQ